MEVNQYFRTRADLVARALGERPTEDLVARDWRFYGAGLFCIAASTAAMLWAAVNLPDPGFFARMAMFLGFVLLAGIWLLTIAQAAHLALVRIIVRSRDSVREKTLAQLLKIGSSIAHKALQRQS